MLRPRPIVTALTLAALCHAPTAAAPVEASRAASTLSPQATPAMPTTAPAPATSPIAHVAYDWNSVAIGGGGFVSGLSFHPTERGLLYARTDVGGAYRWDAASSHWIALTDFLGSADVNLTGIESLALDPSDPERLYLACGTYTSPQMGNGAILVSADRGRSFHRVDMPFKMGANEAGRGNGERLAVDPNQGAIVFFGSRAAGLWKSADHGNTWVQVETFPAIATSEEARDEGPWKQALGITFILFDPASGKTGTATPVLYAGVSTRGQWLYRSLDGGTTWTPVPGQPLGLRPTRPSRAADGTLFFSLADAPGPNTMTDGAVWKLDPHGDTWTNITPLGPKNESPSFGYGAVCVDPTDSRRLIVSTFCRYRPSHDIILRSTDGGRTWRDLFAHSRFNHPGNPWAAHHTPHWMADIRIDPADPGRALFVTGYGVYSTRGLLASDAAPEAALDWDFSNDGLEETVPLGLISPPEGAHLLSALGDIDGFRHQNLDTSGETFAPTPRLTNTESMDFAALRPNTIVRCGTIRDYKPGQVRAAFSEDGGTTWAPLASEPPGSGGAGHVSISADGATIVWTPRGRPPEGATGFELWRPRPGLAHATTDHGASWIPCTGLPAGTTVIADRMEARHFYAFDPLTGTAYHSTDGARSFTVVATGLPALTPTAGGFGGSREAGRLHAIPGSAGELWLESRAEGLSRSVDGGAHWKRLPGIDAAFSLGFGKAAPGAQGPTLFLAGIVAGQRGLFRSIDDGATWVHIDDAQHRFGWVNHVTGDPRIFGRVYFGTGGRGVIMGDAR